MLVVECSGGAVRYVVEEPLLHAGYCRCSRCRAASGSAFSAFAGIEKGAPRQGRRRQHHRRREGSDDNRWKLCGSLLFALVRDGWFVHARTGSLVDNTGIGSPFRIVVDSKAPWHELTDALRNMPAFPLMLRHHRPQHSGGEHGPANDQLKR